MGIQEMLRLSLRTEIERNLSQNGYTLSKLSELTGINSGTLSMMLNGNPPRPMTICQLDALANAFGHKPGWLYELYPEECLNEGKFSRPRVIPYLIRCAEIGRQDCIAMTASKLLDNPKNVSILFSVAEQLFENGKRKESIPFYQFVVDSEKDSYSNHFVMAQYRLFRAALGKNSEENWKAVIRFEPYRKRLPENYQLDALLHLANTCFALHQWRDVEKYADELREMALIIYEDELRKKQNKKTYEPVNTERHLVVYYGQGYLLKSAALEKQGLYEQAKQYVQGYADLSWLELLDETGYSEVRKFQLWAKANTYTLEILMGNVGVMDEYLYFLTKNPPEILPALITIIESANKHGFMVDHIMDRFSEEIKHFTHYRDPLNIDRNFRFRYGLAIYRFHNGQYLTGITETLQAMILSIVKNSEKDFLRCVTTFEAYRKYATDEQKQEYHQILEEVRNDEKRIVALSGSDLGTV
ncbi:helix-turn-helix domain-containing protein [Brevibacillus borstelensis]|uniref:helix-turn-helix domain-containing protein n=1 Tax=Brevibacillus borstelensis TaxID=45462 RepID=UPI0030C1AF99